MKCFAEKVEQDLNQPEESKTGDHAQVNLTLAQKEDLDKRIARHKSGESKSYGRPEARDQIEKCVTYCKSPHTFQ